MTQARLHNAIGYRRAALILFLLVAALASVPALASMPAQSKAAPPVTAVRKTNEELQSSAIRQPAPVSPEIAREAGVSGTVVVEVTIDELGNVTTASALSGHPFLKDAAVTAARGWKWKPFLRNNLPITVRGPINFKFEADPDHNNDAPRPDITKYEEDVRSNPDSFEAHYRLGEAYTSIHQTDKAIDCFKAAVRLKPDFAKGYYQLGSSFLNLGRFKEAIPNFKRALELLPESAEFLTGLGRAYNQAGQYDEAVKIFRGLAAILPGDAFVLHDLGFSLKQTGNFSDAILAYRQLIETSSSYRSIAQIYEQLADSYRKLKLYDEATEAFKQSLAKDPRREDTYLGLGSMYVDQGKIDDAIEVYKKALTVMPDSYRSMFNIGTLVNNAERHVEAIEFFKKALEIKPDYYKALYNLAWAYSRIGRREEALQAYEQAAEHEPYEFRIFLGLGFTYLELGRYEESIAASKRALTLNPDPVALGRIDVNLAVAYMRAKRYADAIEHLEKVTAARPSEPFLFYHLGNAYAETQRWKDSEKALERAISYKADFVDSYFCLSRTLSSQSKWDDAEAILRRAVAIAPRVMETHLTLARLLSQHGKYAESEPPYREALLLSPDNPGILNSLGYSLVQRDEKLDEALKMIQRAVTAVPNNPYFLDSLGWAYFKLGNPSEAERYLLEAARNGGSSATLREHLGDVYDKQGKKTAALSAWQESLSLSSDSEQTARLKAKLAAGANK